MIRLSKVFAVSLLLMSSSVTLLAGEPAGTPKSSVTGELKAVRFSETEEAATHELNQLTAEGWQYVGPLGNGLIAFRKDAKATASAMPLQGEWEYLSYERDGEVKEYQAGKTPALTISGDKWTVGPSPGGDHGHRVEISGRDLVFHGLASLGGLSTEGKSPQPTIALGIFELKGNSLTYCMTSSYEESAFPPGMSPVKKPDSFETKGTENTIYRMRRKK